ncbi:hypothetical protein GGX14DRAFT_407099 [Mycena pura]|uniref:Uncharacterized protein n=1 Tax=Mycena pura TaxID=153505 RepID=A0AAD6US06_9AGAR|nr:hypothetical protein GGX14DRAFT_407099 [Mycena pura]
MSPYSSPLARSQASNKALILMAQDFLSAPAGVFNHLRQHRARLLARRRHGHEATTCARSLFPSHRSAKKKQGTEGDVIDVESDSEHGGDGEDDAGTFGGTCSRPVVVKYPCTLVYPQGREGPWNLNSLFRPSVADFFCACPLTGASLRGGVGSTTSWMVGTIPICFPASVIESGPSRRLLVNCDMARMGEGIDSRTPAPVTGYVIGTPSENGGTAMEGVSTASAQPHATSREIAALRHEVSDPALISDTLVAPMERHGSSRPTVCGRGDSAARRHEVQTSAAHEKRHKSLRIHCALDDSAANPKRLESGLPVDNSAAERLEMSSLETVDDSAAIHSRWSRELADGMPVGQLISRAVCGELGDGTYLPKCWSTTLAATVARTLVMVDKAAEAVAPNLPVVAGVDTGPGKTEGAYVIHDSGIKLKQKFDMVDWNDLLEIEDQLGPIPSCWTGPMTGADSQKFELPILEYGSKDWRDLFLPGVTAEEFDSDFESSTTLETLSSDGDPVIFCGMSRIKTTHSEGSDPEPPKRRNKSSKPSGHSKLGALHHKAKKNRANSSSYGRSQRQ